MELKAAWRPRLASLFRRALLLQTAAVGLLLSTFLPALGTHIFAESEVKAVFLFNLTKFIVWPEEIEGGPKAKFSIAILGPDPFDRHLDQVIRGETVKGRNITIHHYRNEQEIPWQETDLVFISENMLGSLADIRVAARRAGVLTVGDTAGFCRAGGMVNMPTVDSRVKIEINLGEAKESGFVVSSHLLRLAAIVTTAAEGEQ